MVMRISLPPDGQEGCRESSLIWRRRVRVERNLLLRFKEHSLNWSQGDSTCQSKFYDHFLWFRLAQSLHNRSRQSPTAWCCQLPVINCFDVLLTDRTDATGKNASNHTRWQIGRFWKEFGGGDGLDGKLFLVSTLQNSSFNVCNKDLRMTWVLAKKSWWQPPRFF